ncbi:MAG: Ig-like domain repeat protein, partial [Candidatus Acidiferrales bacterium]
NDPDAVAVNSVTNKINVANAGCYSCTGSVTVIDGANNTTWTVSAGNDPDAVAVNSVTNKIYVPNYSDNNVTVIDGANNTTWTVSAGTEPDGVAVNPVTNKIYVANCGSNNVTVIDGATSATVTVSAGSCPGAVAVNQVSNKIYVANLMSNNVTVIDGTTNTTWTVSAGSYPGEVAVNPVTNQIYVPNGSGDNVTVISPNTEVSVPLTAVLAGTTDAQTIAGNAIFSTSNDTPSFTATVTSSYTPNAPPPTALYYQLDTAQSAWKGATATSTSGSNPADYSFTLSDVPLGVHTVYAFAAYGDEGTSASNLYGLSQGVGESPSIGELSAFTFVVLPIPTTTQLTADVNPQNAGSPVTLTAYVQATYGGDIPGGTVTFLDGAALLGQGAVDSSGHAYFQTSSLAVGTHSITAAYGGGAGYGASTCSPLSEVIAGAPASIAAVSGGGQSAPLNTAFSNPLVASVTDSNNNPVPNVSVTFSGAGLSFSGGGTALTGSKGQASITATPTVLGALLASANVTGLSPATFSLTATRHTATVTLTASTASTFVQNSVTFMVAVNSVGGTPTGTVTFMDGSTVLGSATADRSGTATLSVSTLAPGSHSITAVYSGDAICAGSTSPAVSETVRDFQLAVTGSESASIPAGGTADYVLQLSLGNGTTVPSAVTFSLTGLPTGASCTIAPSTIAAGSAAQTVIVLVQTTTTARLRPLFDRYGASFALALLPILGMVQLRSSKRRRAMRVFWGLLLLIAALGMGACASNNKTAQTYTLQVSATSGSLVHSTALTLTIQYPAP